MPSSGPTYVRLFDAQFARLLRNRSHGPGLLPTESEAARKTLDCLPARRLVECSRRRMFCPRLDPAFSLLRAVLLVYLDYVLLCPGVRTLYGLYCCIFNGKWHQRLSIPYANADVTVISQMHIHCCSSPEREKKIKF